MSRIAGVLADLKAQGKKALIPYIVAGDPAIDATVPLMHRMVAQGATIIELGVPFSDPMAEGPTIALGHERALANRVSLRKVLEMVAEFRQTDNITPVVLMGYANPVERMGYEVFAKAATEAGVDGVLTVDLPPEEAVEPNAIFKAHNLDTIFLISPTTEDERAKSILSLASGYVYCVSLKGVTGAGHLDIGAVAERLTQLRDYSDLPLCVGFGIKDAESARAIASVADGAVVGSVLVNACAEHAGKPIEDLSDALGHIIGEMHRAFD